MGTELICELVETVNYRQVEENFHVQSCYTTKDRICDTVHEIDTTTKDDLQCIQLETPNCHMEDKILVSTRSTPPPRTTSSAYNWKRQTAIWRTRSWSTRSARIPSNLSALRIRSWTTPGTG